MQLFNLRTMFTKGNKLYADTYKYLRHKTKNIIALSFVGSADDFEEVDMELPIHVEIVGNMLFWQNRKLATSPKNFDYSTIKEHIIKSRYTYDEQIAIMLNKDKSEEDNVLYLKMQSWRDFASEIAKIADIRGYEAITEIEVMRDKLLSEIMYYDSSDEVNSFTIKGVGLWLDKATRTGLRLRFESEKALGKTKTSLWYGDVMFELQLDDAISMIHSIEVYASECYDNTQRNCKEVRELTDIEQLKSYDYKKGYPEKLVFG